MEIAPWVMLPRKEPTEETPVYRLEVEANQIRVSGPGVLVFQTQEGASGPRRELMDLKQKSYEQMVREYYRRNPLGKRSENDRRDSAHGLAQQEFQRLIDRYHQLLYREVDPNGNYEIRIPKKAKLMNPELTDTEIRPLQGQIKGAEVCAGLISTWSNAGRDSQLMETVLAADIDPAARREFQRKHPKARMMRDCRELTIEDYEAAEVQIVQASVPCTPWTLAGSQQGKHVAEGHLLEEMVPIWRGAYKGSGMPVVVIECTLGFEATIGRDDADLQAYVQRLLPEHIVKAGITKAHLTPSPLDGESAIFTKHQWWVVAVAKAFFESGIQIQTPWPLRENNPAHTVMDTDRDRAQGYWMMPAEEVLTCEPVNKEIRDTYRIARLSGPTGGSIGTAGFPTKITDPTRGSCPTITTGSRGGWFADEVAGEGCYRQLTLRELARGSRIREGGINPKFLEIDSALGTRALAMCIPQNVADFALVEVIRQYTTPGADGRTPEQKFLERDRIQSEDPDESQEPMWGSVLDDLDHPGTGREWDLQMFKELEVQEAVAQTLQGCVWRAVNQRLQGQVGRTMVSLVATAVIEKWQRKPAKARAELRRCDLKWPIGRIHKEGMRTFRRTEGNRRAQHVKLETIPEGVEEKRNCLLTSSTSTKKGESMKVLLKKQGDGRWECPDEGEILSQGRAFQQRDGIEIMTGQWAHGEHEGPWNNLHLMVRYVRKSLVPLTTDLQWFAVEELPAGNLWVNQEEEGRVKWATTEAAAWMGNYRNTPILPGQRAFLEQQREILVSPRKGWSQDRYTQLLGRTIRGCTIPGSRTSASILPVTVEFRDFFGVKRPLPKTDKASTPGGVHLIQANKQWCATSGILIAHGIAPPGATMISLHLSNHSGEPKIVDAGEPLCYAAGVGVVEEHEASKDGAEPVERPGSGEDPPPAVASFQADTLTGPEDRRQQLIKQRKDLTGDEVYRYGEGEEQTKVIDELFEPFMALFDPDNLGRAAGVECEIDTGDAKPILNQPYRLSPKERDIIREEIAKMLKLGVIQPSKSPWGSLPVLARKPDGSTRFCVDYRAVNKVTKPDAMPIPRIDDTLAALQGAKYFTTVDAMSGFWQIPVKEEHIEKTAFLTVDGSWEYTRMPFGLRNSPACYQRLMNNLLAGLTWKTCLVYIDDCTIFSSTFEQHVKDVREVLQRFMEAGLTLKMSKCKFFASQLEFLGHVVSGEGIRPSPKKVQAIQEVKPPSNITELRGFLGMTGWFRKFIQNYARIALPLTRLTKKENRRRIAEEMKTEECMRAFKSLKLALVGSEVVLMHPDFSKKFRVDLDASDNQIGGVLLQHDDEKEAWRPIEYLSRKYTKELKDKEFAPTHMEAQALQACVDRWRPYLLDKPFDLVTDHTALKSLPTRKMDQNTLTRHQILMQPYDYTIVYRPGCIHHVPDGLSRLPREDSPATDLPYQDYADQIPTLEATQTLKEGEAVEAPPGPVEPEAEVGYRGAAAASFSIETAPPATRGLALCIMASTANPTNEQEMEEEMTVLNSMAMDRFTGVGLTQEQLALVNTLDFDDWKDVRETLGVTKAVLNKLKKVVRRQLEADDHEEGDEGVTSDQDSEDSDESEAADEDGDLEVMEMNQMMAHHTEYETDKIGLPVRVLRILHAKDFDDWGDVERTTKCTEAELRLLQEWVRARIAEEARTTPEEEEDTTQATPPPCKYGTPADPGLRLPTDEQLLELQKADEETEGLRRYCADPENSPMPSGYTQKELSEFRLVQGKELLVHLRHTPTGRTNRRREREALDEEGLTALENVKRSVRSYQRVIPAGPIRGMLLHYFHGHELHQHPGVERTLEWMHRAVWWKGMRKDVEDHVAACPCLKTGRYPEGLVRARMNTPVCRLNGELTAPHQRLCLDHKSLPRTKEGYTAVLIMVDGFSTMLQLAPQKAITAEETALTVVSRWMQPFGRPESIHADGATSFTGEVITAINRALMVSQSRIVPGNPRGNALAESMVGRVKTALTNVVSGFERQWSTFLPFVSLMLNESVNMDTGLAPVTVHMGRQPTAMTELEVPYVDAPELQELAESEKKGLTNEQAARKWAMNIIAVMKGTCAVIKQDRYDAWNRRHEDRLGLLEKDLLEVGDLVYYWNDRVKSRLQAEKQLHNPWTGPYPVKKVCREGRVIVIIRDGKEQLCYLRQLRRYLTPITGLYPTEGAGYCAGHPVEVLAYREKHGDHQYFTRYINHLTEVKEWTTWQLLSPQLIQKFLTQLQGNRHVRRYPRGTIVSVWWPRLRRSKEAVVAAVSENLLQVQYKNGDWGQAYVAVDGQVLSADNDADGAPKERAKPRGVKSARHRAKKGAEPEGGRRTKGYQLVPREE